MARTKSRKQSFGFGLEAEAISKDIQHYKLDAQASGLAPVQYKLDAQASGSFRETTRLRVELVMGW